MGSARGLGDDEGWSGVVVFFLWLFTISCNIFFSDMIPENADTVLLL